MKIELIERDGQFFIRRKWGFITLWWDNGYEGGWGLFRWTMMREEAEAVFFRLKQLAIDNARFAGSSDKVIHTFETNK